VVVDETCGSRIMILGIIEELIRDMTELLTVVVRRIGCVV
jgi:hypothetical protein